MLSTQEFALLPNSKKKNCFAHRTHVGNLHRPGVQLQPMRAAKTRRALHTRSVCDSKQKSVHFSPSFVQHLHWYVLCAPFPSTSPSSRCVPGGGMNGSDPASGSNHIQIKCTDGLQKSLPQISASSLKEKSAPSQGMRKVALCPPFPPTHKPEQIHSRSTFHFENLALREFARLPSSKKSDVHSLSSSS